MISLQLGAGRLTKDDKIDPKAGIIFYPKIGDKIKRGEVMLNFIPIERYNEWFERKSLFKHKISEKRKARQKLIKEIIL